VPWFRGIEADGERVGFVPTGKVEDGETEAVLRLVF
jgi:hypothetical protein